MNAPAASYGDVTSEYWALRHESGVVTGIHDVVWVRGPDAVTFLDGLLSQDIAGMTVGSVERSLLLAPQGKLRAALWVLRGDQSVGLVTDAGRGEVVASDLGRFKIRVDASIEAEPNLVTELWGGAAPRLLERVRGSQLERSTWTDRDGIVVAALPFAHVELPRYLGIGWDTAAFLAGGARRCGSLAVDAVRIESGEPTVGRDLDDSTIPQEGGVVEGAVSFTKGCYLGQELVARIDARGRVNRHLRGLVVGTNVRPPEGAEIVDELGAPVGAVGSVAESLELRAPVGLALVRREVLPGSPVTLRWEGGAVPAVVRELPLLRNP
jgi:folate-binding protein YgfZ